MTDDVRGWALVTGACGGIGMALCHELARRGHALAIVGRDPARLSELAGDLAREHAVEVQPVTCDFAVPGAAAHLASRMDQLGIDVEVLVNNAGYGSSERFVEGSPGAQRRLVQVDVVAPMELCRLLGARMAAARHGKILNVASVAAVMPGPGMATYFASKAFVESLSQALHEELRPYGVSVMALCPGPVRTAFWDRANQSTVGYGPFMVSPKHVARVAVTALDRGRAVCAPGLVSKAFYVGGRHLPNMLKRQVARVFLHR